MPIVNNGTTMTTIKNNTTAMQTVVYNSTTVYTAGPVTADPSVGTPFCRSVGGFNYTRMIITNNDSSEVTIYVNNISRGTLSPHTSMTYETDAGVRLPYNYSFTVHAEAAGKAPSQIIERSGSISLCPVV